MSSSVTAGLAFAMPVRPDLLGERLEAYAKVVPVLRTLRLCHRFGKGPDVHVTKLPAEIELAIEGHIIREQWCIRPFWNKWHEAFKHFEGRCDPMSHLADSYSPLSDEVEGVEMCESCEVEHYWCTKRCQNRCKPADSEKCWTCSQRRDPDNCMNTCEAKIHHEMNELALEWDLQLDIDDDCKDWETMIKQSKDGNFVQYDKVLRQHFGLEVFMSTTRIGNEDHDIWPRDIAHTWHRKEELKTTLCYLTVAKQVAPPKTYAGSDVEFNRGAAILEGAQAVVIKPFGSKDKAKASKRFGRAMNVLGLKAYVHPSQRTSLIMPSLEEHEDEASKEGPSTKSTAIKWPRLVLLIKNIAADVTIY